MTSYRKTRLTGERTTSRRRRLGAHTINELLARRRRLRTQIGVAAAMLVSAGLLLIEFA